MHQFDHRWAGYGHDGETSNYVLLEQKSNPLFEPSPRYWVAEQDVRRRLQEKGWSRPWTIGWRRSARNTDARTIISCVLCNNIGIGDSIFLINTRLESKLQAALIANMNSIVLDFAARQKISGSNISFYFVNQFPIFPPSFYTARRLAFLIPRVLELTYTSQAVMLFARDLGHDGPPFCWDEDRRAQLRADLDAFFARAYGLTSDDLSTYSTPRR